MVTMKRILIVEDDDTIALGIRMFLEKKDFSAVSADTISLAIEKLQSKQDFDLVILDLNLPDGSGYDFCNLVKAQKDIPVIFLTVRDEEKDIVKGLDMGADDYIVKPFRLNELLSRINAVLRRTVCRQQQRDILICGNLKLDKTQTKAFYMEDEVSLTAGEYQLLLVMLENKNQTLTRQVLLEKLWDIAGNFVNDNTLTVTMKRLREKLGSGTCIKTVRGIGYRAEDEDE